MTDVVLTADRTLMTDYNGIIPLGHIACLPERLVPKLFLNLLLPKIKEGQCTYALRRVEAKLLDEGFNVSILPPQDIKKIKKLKPKIVGVSTVDPFTKKPHPWTLTNIFGGGESVTQREFLNLLFLLNRMKSKQPFSIIIGGPGASEFETDNKYHNLIDSYVMGSGEGSIELFQMAMNNEPLPKKFVAKSVGIDELSIIKGAARMGHVQLTQGCPRGCMFCAPTLMKWISFPKKRILDEIETNFENGIKYLSLITEDFFLYGSKEVEVNNNAIVDLINSIFKLRRKYNVNYTNISDVSIASTIKGKKTCEEISDIMGCTKELPVDTIVGLETGSERLIKKYMEGKAKPYNPDDWSELVKTAINILNDNNWYPLCHLITGLPDEREEDVTKTLDLVDDLKQNKLLYYIFYFAPVEGSELEKSDFFNFDNITERRWELFYKCWMETIRSIKDSHFLSLMQTFRGGTRKDRIKNRILEYAINKSLDGIKRELNKYRTDPFGLRETYSSVSLKGLNLIKFLGQKYLT